MKGYCEIPIMGQESDLPIGCIKLKSNMAEKLARISVELETKIILSTTVKIDGGKHFLLSVRIGFDGARKKDKELT